MALLVNLLPWRAMRRRARWRFWLLLFAGSSLLLSGYAVYLWQLAGLQTDNLRLIRQQQQALNQALQQQVQAARQQQLQQQQWQQDNLERQIRQQQIAVWREILETLADALPVSAWLSAIHYQQQQLRIDGYVQTPAALADIAGAFSGLPGFAAPRAIATEREAEDRWRFSFLLQRCSPCDN